MISDRFHGFSVLANIADIASSRPATSKIPRSIPSNESDPALQPYQAEVASLHWIPISTLIPPFPKAQWSNVQIDISSRLSPRNKLVRLILRGLVGNMK
jgi:hypothetical protein